MLHLLRDRSENLEMMGIRLTWEENRQHSWKERRQIIQDLEAFSTSRARWSPSIYDTSTKSDETPTLSRRASNASLASVGSDNALNSHAFSRTARFKLAELLSRDAAQFSGRVMGLKHGKVTAAGKALDKLIDHSRRPVPDELLDEQDRLEEKCISEMENISKFTMNLVMQWRKYDNLTHQFINLLFHIIGQTKYTLKRRRTIAQLPIYLKKLKRQSYITRLPAKVPHSCRVLIPY